MTRILRLAALTVLLMASWSMGDGAEKASEKGPKTRPAGKEVIAAKPDKAKGKPAQKKTGLGDEQLAGLRQKELDKHNRRIARLERIQQLLTDKGNEQAASRVGQALEKENRRHERVLARLGRMQQKSSDPGVGPDGRPEGKGKGKGRSDEKKPAKHVKGNAEGKEKPEADDEELTDEPPKDKGAPKGKGTGAAKGKAKGKKDK